MESVALGSAWAEDGQGGWGGAFHSSSLLWGGRSGSGHKPAPCLQVVHPEGFCQILFFQKCHLGSSLCIPDPCGLPDLDDGPF